MDEMDRNDLNEELNESLNTEDMPKTFIDEHIKAADDIITTSVPEEVPTSWLEASELEENTESPEPEISIVDISNRSNGIFFEEGIKVESKPENRNSFKKFIAGVLIASIVGGSFFGVSLGAAQKYFAVGESKELSTQETTRDESLRVESPIFSFNADNEKVETPKPTVSGAQITSAADIVDLVEPAVVGITSAMARQTYGGFLNPGGSIVTPASGSGIIFHETNDKVFIVTNNHVVSGAQSVGVSISGSEQVPASPVGADSQNDLAVISVEKADLEKVGIKSVTIAEFGKSDSLRVGEMAIAIGNALGEGNSATGGIISAINKVITVEGTRTLTVIQTDAAINFGNSGGPLVNSSGQVIGINTAKLSESSVEGMGYAIPTDIAKPIIEDLMSPRPSIGISGHDYSQSAADLYGIPLGIVVSDVAVGSSAAKSGLVAGDIIIEINGEKVVSMETLKAVIKKYKIGDSVDLTVIRDAKERVTISVVLQDSNQTVQTLTQQDEERQLQQQQQQQQQQQNPFSW